MTSRTQHQRGVASESWQGHQAAGQLLSLKEVAQRWSCCTETVKRKTRAGELHPIRFNARMIRYALSEIIQVERQAGAIT
jgi:CHAD domain-containing protein